MIALMVIDVDAAMSQTWHLILLAGIAYGVSVLALFWVDRNPRLVERAGLGPKNSDPVAPAPAVARRLYTGVEDEWTFVPVRHSGMDD
jgi:hypothetical protein